MSIEIYFVGDRGITLSIQGEVNLVDQQKIWWVGAEIERSIEFKDTIIDVVPGMNNLTLFLNPYQTKDKKALKEMLVSLWNKASKQDLSEQFQGKLIEVPVHYGGEKGPDLQEVASIHKMKVEQLIQLHTAPIYTVYFVGFMPGFVYLGGLDSQIHTERRSTPRLQIPAGSVGIGGAQTGVYPGDSPGGWQIIGNTSVSFFDVNREIPSLFMPGDQLKFVVEGVTL